MFSERTFQIWGLELCCFKILTRRSFAHSVCQNEAITLREKTTPKGCLGLIWGFEKFRKYLYGVEFLLETDHKPLFYMQPAKVLNPRIMSWAIKLQPYRLKIVTIRGRDNLGADYLSR